jgi:hypothetical protein
MPEGSLTLVQAVVDAAALGLDIREAQFDPGLDLIGRVAIECLQ